MSKEKAVNGNRLANNQDVGISRKAHLRRQIYTIK